MMVLVMSDCEVESLYDGLRWMASGIPGWFFLMCSMKSHIRAWNMTRVEWLKRYLAQPFYSWVEHGSSIPILDFSSLMKGYFSLYFYENYNRLYVDYMVVISLVFLSLLCWLFACFMITIMSGSHDVLTCY